MAGQQLSAGVLDRSLAELAPVLAVDPRPPAAMRVGGIGHRKIAKEARDAIAVTVGAVLAEIEQAARKALTDRAIAAHYNGEPIFALVTPLAEGADRLIAQSSECIHSKWRLGAVLPFAKSVYEKTFDLDPDPEPAITEFNRLLKKSALPEGYGTLVLDGKSATEKERNAGYRAASSTIIRWCDILIAIVEHARLESETGYGVAEAMAWNVPIIVIDPAEPSRYRLVLDGAELPEAADLAAALANTVTRLVTVPPAIDDVRKTEFFADYLRERIDSNTQGQSDFEYQGPFTAFTVAPPWIAWGAVVNRNLRGTFKSLLLAKAKDGTPPTNAQEMPFDADTASQFVGNFLHYNRADALARLYGDLHRGVQIVAVAVGIIAALVALLHALVENLPAAAFTLFEFVCLVFMFAAVKTSHHQRWLQRWIDYRLLAEIMRHAKFLSVAGRPMPFADTRAPLTRSDGRRRHWVENHIRAVLRAQTIAVPGRNGTAEINSLSTVKSYVADRLVLDQLVYHRQTATYERSLDTLLRRILDVLTPTTIGLIGIKFIAEVFEVTPWLHTGLELPLILLPAVTSGIIAIRGSNQYAVTARRSDGMVTAMRFHRDLVLASTSFFELGERATNASRTLLGEVEGWTDVFSDRHIEIEV